VPEKTFFMIKPDGVARGLVDEIFKRLVQAGLKVAVDRRATISEQQAAELYLPHLGKTFYDGLVKFITSGPVRLCLVEGERAIVKTRALMGATDPLAAERGTIRGDLREKDVINEDGVIKNLVHGSDSLASAQRELAIFFPGL
jgi:nucleoside-diphosphate kinase